MEAINLEELKQVFLDNKVTVLSEMKNCFRVLSGKKVKSVDIEEGVLYLWNFYYIKTLNKDKEIGGRVIYNLITEFDQMIKKDDGYIYNGNTRNLEIDKEFTDIWMKNSILEILEYLYKDASKAKIRLSEDLKKIDRKYKNIIRLNI